jgi:hypothetical protein
MVMLFVFDWQGGAVELYYEANSRLGVPVNLPNASRKRGTRVI